VQVLVEASCLLGLRRIEGRHIGGSKQDSTCATNVGNIHSFLGLTGYYQRFMSHPFLTSKSYAHHLYAHNQVVIYTTRM
jgi:hypothetical protein